MAPVSAGMFDGQGGAGWGVAHRRDVPLTDSGASDAVSLHPGEAAAGLQARQGLAVREVGAGPVAPEEKPGVHPAKDPLRRRLMFSGEYLCKLDEKGRFLLPSVIRDLLCPDGHAGEKGVVFLKRTDPTSLKVYPLSEWTNLLKQTMAKLDEEQSRLFMHFVVSETATTEIAKPGRIPIPGKLRRHSSLAAD